PSHERTHERTRALLDRLARLNAKTAFVAGALLGVGGPKRLTVSLVAGTTIAAAWTTAQQQAAGVVVYVAIGGMLVWVPVALFLVAGRRSHAWLVAAETWLAARRRMIAVVLLLVFGALLVGDGVSNLL